MDGFNDDGFLRAFKRIKELYTDDSKMRSAEFRNRFNPPKQSFSIEDNGECVLKCTNVMYAKTEYGNFTKVITLDDISGKTDETIIYTDNDMNVTIKRNIGLTQLRCAIMAAIAIDLNFNVVLGTRFGFIGNGRINLKTCEILNHLYGIKECVIRGSRSYRGKNKSKFEYILSGDCRLVVDDTESLALLNTCDIVICCTSSYEEKDMISVNQLNKPKLIIVQDSGYLLDESFRGKADISNYTDHKEQLLSHYSEEFPFDKEKHSFEVFGGVRRLNKRSLQKRAIYLYGIALADAIIFEECCLGGDND